MASYVASISFADGDQIQTRASGPARHPDAHADLRAEAIRGMRELLAISRMVDDPEAIEVLDAVDQLEDEQ